MQHFLLVLLAAICLLFVCHVNASSHGEAPNQVKMPLTDSSDVYAFVSYEDGREDYVTFLANYGPFEQGFNGPNYHNLDDKFFYEFNIDNTGDGKADIVFQFAPQNEIANPPYGVQLNIGGKKQSIALKYVGPVTAGDDSNLNFFQYYRLNVIKGGSSKAVTEVSTGNNYFSKPFDYVGPKTFPDYDSYANQYIYSINIPGCGTPGRVFVGQRRDPFVISLGKTFDLVNYIPFNYTESPFPGYGVNQSNNNNDLINQNVQTIALEVPSSCLVANANSPVIGVWSTSRSRFRGIQKSRLGNPLVNELLIGLPYKDHWSRRQPWQDGQLNQFITYPTFPAILNALFLGAVNQLSAANPPYTNIAPTNFPRKDLAQILLIGLPGLNYLSQSNGAKFIEMIRLNTSIAPVTRANQNSLGVFGGDVAGYPNGRRPGDDIVDITLRASMGLFCYLEFATTLCNKTDAPFGGVAYTDGAPSSATMYGATFPYINSPYSDS